MYELKDIVIEDQPMKPPRIILHGLSGMGKSTLGATTPLPIFLPTEDGLGEIKVARFPLIILYDDFMNYLNMLKEESHPYKTVVIDSLDWLELLVWDRVCATAGTKSIEDIGWSKGYVFALTFWDEILVKLDELRDQGMIILFLAHNEIKTFHPPDGEAYDRYQIKLHHKAQSKLTEWADCVLFATYKVYVQKDSPGDMKGKGVGSGERVIYTEERPAFKAKSRYKMPFEIPFSWEAILSYIKKGSQAKPNGKIKKVIMPEPVKETPTQPKGDVL